jgi:hypothetical protein
MYANLVPHPTTPSKAVRAIDVAINRLDSLLTLRYTATGNIDALEIAPLTAPTRTDELWRGTCFELFLQAAGEIDYREFNFAPSRQWAAYVFDDYRRGMRPLELADVPKIEIEVTPQTLTQTISLSLNGAFTETSSLLAGLSAVIRKKDGGVSYWALAHPDATPDFHARGSFTFALPQP